VVVTSGDDGRPLVVHVIHRLEVGGMENGLVNLIRGMTPGPYRHAVVCLSGFTDFKERLNGTGTRVFSLDKSPGKDLGSLYRLWLLLRQLKPAILHTRNLSALECQLMGWLAGVPVRIHGEHGRDYTDVQGTNAKYLLIRRVMRAFVHRYIVVSKDLAGWLAQIVGVPDTKIVQIYNGVDVQRFSPRQRRSEVIPGGHDRVVVGTIGRLRREKDQITLVRAFAEMLRNAPVRRSDTMLAVVGDGPLWDEVNSVVAEEGITEQCWLPGPRSDTPEIYRSLDVFVLPSRFEGISNVILEAMGSGLPVVATRVGGNVELVKDGVTGYLVEPGDVQGMAAAVDRYLSDPALRKRHGGAARRHVLDNFGLSNMVASYQDCYRQLTTARNLRIASSCVE
jgi:sugar transferase (PEP-CTERM/EpsH1 system associated)